MGGKEMENCIEDNLYLSHSAAALRKVASMQEEYMASMKTMFQYSLMWNKLGLTMAENGLNALVAGMGRWSDAGMMYQRNIVEAFGPHEKRKIDRMVQEIMKRT